MLYISLQFIRFLSSTFSRFFLSHWEILQYELSCSPENKNFFKFALNLFKMSIIVHHFWRCQHLNLFLISLLIIIELMHFISRLMKTSWDDFFWLPLSSVCSISLNELFKNLEIAQTFLYSKTLVSFLQRVNHCFNVLIACVYSDRLKSLYNLLFWVQFHRTSSAILIWDLLLWELSVLK